MKRMILVLSVVAGTLGCARVTPTIRMAGDVVSCRHDRYVAADPDLSEAEKAARLRMSQQFREALGIVHEHGCPDYGR